MDSLDITPEQALSHALAVQEDEQFDGAIVLLFKDPDGADARLATFVSGAVATQVISLLEIAKTRTLIRLLNNE